MLLAIGVMYMHLMFRLSVLMPLLLLLLFCRRFKLTCIPLRSLSLVLLSACRVKDTYDSTRAKMQEAADSVEPHNEMEAIKSSGGIPSNTADLVNSGIPSACPDSH